MSSWTQREQLGTAGVVFNFSVGLVGLSALCVATLTAFGMDATHAPEATPQLLLTFLALFVFTRVLRFDFPPNITASLILPMQLASVLLLGPVPTAWLALPAFFIEVLLERPLTGLIGQRRRVVLGIIALNLGMEALVTLAAGACWYWLAPVGGLTTAPASVALVSFGALLGTFVVFKGVNETLLLAGHWMRGTPVREYLGGARKTVLIETLTLPVAVLLVLIHGLTDDATFYIFIVTLLLAAFLLRSLTRARSQLSDANADLTRRVREIQTLAEIGRAISADIELGRLLETVKMHCEDILPANHYFMALYTAGEDELHIASEVIQGETQEPQEIPLGEGLTSHVIQSGEPLLVRDMDEELGKLPVRPLQVDDHPNRSWLGVPMVARGEVVGAIVLQDPREDAYDENDSRVLLSIASQAAISVKNARLHQEALHSLLVEAENRELKRLNAKKTEFVNMVSHQFRTPLTTVMGYTHLLLERLRRQPEGSHEPVKDLERHLATVHSESKRLAQMVEELLNLSRIRSGHLPLTRQTFDLNELVRETLASHELIAREGGHEFRTELLPSDSQPELSTEGDSNFIRQVLANMVANAIKYAPEGSPILVRTELQDGDAVVEVVDEGPGVPPGDLERVFEEFYRAPGVTLDLPGTGLGLSICRGIVEAQRGRAWAVRRGPGTAFCFSLPRASREADDAASEGVAGGEENET
jgi:signal transduction histidine kinase